MKGVPRWEKAERVGKKKESERKQESTLFCRLRGRKLIGKHQVSVLT